MGNAFIKDPDAINVPYSINWDQRTPTSAAGTGYLGSGETITSSTWIVPTGITKVSDIASTTVTTIRLSGGTDGQSYTLVNRITTSSGVTDDESIVILVRQK